MKRYALAVAALGLVIAGSASAHTSTYFGFQIGIGNAPPPPRVVFAGPPPMYCEPDTRVYVVNDDYDDYYGDDCDVFRYGPDWYLCSDGYWYRSRSYRGPFMVIDVRYVPRPIFYVPANHWHHYPGGMRGYTGGWNHSGGQGGYARRGYSGQGWNGGGYSQDRGYDSQRRYKNPRVEQDQPRSGDWRGTEGRRGTGDQRRYSAERWNGDQHRPEGQRGRGQSGRGEGRGHEGRGGQGHEHGHEGD